MGAIDYYENPNQYGGYQYITFEEIVNTYMASMDSDDYTSTVTRDKVILQARLAIQELYFDVANENKAISLTLDDLLTVVLPPDYVDYTRISWVDDKGLLHPMATNKNKTTAITYLQDNNLQILFDHNGCVLADSSIIPSSKDSLVDGKDTLREKFLNSGCHCYTFSPNANMSNAYPNGSFNIDKSFGLIQFSSDVKSKTIVLEYVSDGLYSGCDGDDDIKIHKFCDKAVQDFIYYGLIVKRRNVPANEKFRARKEYYNSRRIAKRRLNGMKIADILQVFKGESKWIKN